MKLNFHILQDAAILEARSADRVYQIVQKTDNYFSTVNGTKIGTGHLYECMSVCNLHERKEHAQAWLKVVNGV